MIHANQMAALAAAIAQVAPLSGPADATLSAFFRAHPALGARDRAFVAEGVFAWLRRRRSLEAIAGSTDPRRLALAVTVREGVASVWNGEAYRRFREQLYSSEPPPSCRNCGLAWSL